jgi:hypothetical protein
MMQMLPVFNLEVSLVYLSRSNARRLAQWPVKRATLSRKAREKQQKHVIKTI